MLRVTLVSNKMGDEWTIWQSWVPAVRPPTEPPKGPVIDGSRINAPEG